MMKEVSERQMLRIREKQILEKARIVFGLEAKDVWPGSSTVQQVVRASLYGEAIQTCAQRSMEDFMALGGDEAAWATLCRQLLKEEPDGDEISQLVMPASMHEAIRLRDLADKAKGAN